MKIGKLTFDGYNNYGNSLQNYALQEYLQTKFSSNVENIWHSPEELLDEFWKWGRKDDLKFVLNHNGFRNDIQKGIKAWELARRTRGLDFTQEYINNRYYVKNLSQVSDDYDYFIVGSDQVWNPDNPRIKEAFLQFAPRNKRISFAASIGAQKIPEDKKAIYINGIMGMKAISVREDKAAELIYDLTGKEVDVLLDPVFCICEAKWRQLSRKPFWLNTEDYIFAYFLGNIPESVFRVAKEKQLSIIRCFNKNDFNQYIISPQEWLYLISNARIVATDSFHATAFSLIFKQNFVVYGRHESDRHKQMITRIESLLNTFKMEDRIVTTEKNIVVNETDSEKIETIIEQERGRIDKFIETALS